MLRNMMDSTDNRFPLLQLPLAYVTKPKALCLYIYIYIYIISQKHSLLMKVIMWVFLRTKLLDD